jgi:hypothetical protein
MRPSQKYLATITPKEFVFTIDTTKTVTGGTDASSFQLPLNNIFAIWNFEVFWGDGNSEIVTGSGALVRTHTYSTPGIYQIRMNGVVRGIKMFVGERNKLLSITRFGGTGFFIDIQGNFSGNTNLDLISLNDAPVMETTQAGYFNNDFFSGCTNLTVIPTIDLWNLEKSRSLQRWFLGCSKYVGQVPTIPLTNTQLVSYGLMLFNATLWNQNVVGRLPILPQIVNVDNMFTGTSMSAENYSRFVIYWANMVYAQGGLPANLLFANGVTIRYNSINYGGTPYNNAVDAIAYLQSCGWTVTNGGLI